MYGLQLVVAFDHHYTHTHTHTHTDTRLTALCPGPPGWARTRKVKNYLDFTEARDSEWQWHQVGHMQVCTLLQTDNHASNPPLSFLQAGCPSCRPTNSVKALKASLYILGILDRQHRLLRRSLFNVFGDYSLADIDRL